MVQWSRRSAGDAFANIPFNVEQLLHSPLFVHFLKFDVQNHSGNTLVCLSALVSSHQCLRNSLHEYLHLCENATVSTAARVLPIHFSPILKF